jgi:hypothetical protein
MKTRWKLTIGITLSIGAILFVGCLTPGPSTTDSSIYSRDTVYHLQRDILVANALWHTVTFEVDEEDSLIRRGQSFERLPKNTKIKILRTVSRRQEPGIFHFYECEVIDTKKKFELAFRMRDSLGLPPYNNYP